MNSVNLDRNQALENNGWYGAKFREFGRGWKAWSEIQYEIVFYNIEIFWLRRARK